MRIDKLDIRGFGKIHNLIIEFSKGLIWFTVKTRPGNNGSMVYPRHAVFSERRKKHKRRRDTSFEKIQSMERRFYGGSIVYTLDSGASFTVERDFNNNTVKIFDSFSMT